MSSRFNTAAFFTTRLSWFLIRFGSLITLDYLSKLKQKMIHSSHNIWRVFILGDNKSDVSKDLNVIDNSEINLTTTRNIIKLTVYQ